MGCLRQRNVEPAERRRDGPLSGAKQDRGHRGFDDCRAVDGLAWHQAIDGVDGRDVMSLTSSMRNRTRAALRQGATMVLPLGIFYTERQQGRGLIYPRWHIALENSGWAEKVYLAGEFCYFCNNLVWENCSLSVVSFPLLLDRNVGQRRAGRSARRA